MIGNLFGLFLLLQILTKIRKISSPFITQNTLKFELKSPFDSFIRVEIPLQLQSVIIKICLFYFMDSKIMDGILNNTYKIVWNA